MSEHQKSSFEGNQLFAWQESRGGLVIVLLFDLLMTYILVSLAIDTGSLLQWVAALVFLALAITAAVKLIRKVTRHG